MFAQPGSQVTQKQPQTTHHACKNKHVHVHVCKRISYDAVFSLGYAEHDPLIMSYEDMFQTERAGNELAQTNKLHHNLSTQY